MKTGEVFQLSATNIPGEGQDFMLVEVGYQEDFASLKKALEERGIIPQDGYRKAFMKRFPNIKKYVATINAESVFKLSNQFIWGWVDGSPETANYSFGEYWQWLIQIRRNQPML